MAPNIRKRERYVAPVSAQSELSHANAATDTSGAGNANLRLKLEYLSTSSLTPPPRELRKRNKKQVSDIAASIMAFGNLHPIVIDDRDTIVAGVGRYLAARELGLTHVPVLRASHLSAEEVRLFALADNKIAEGSTWAVDALKVELSELSAIPGLDLDLTGFSSLEIENVLLDGAAAATDACESEEIEEPGDTPTISRVGDLFQIGDHMILCGSAREAASFETLMRGEKARVIFADLPYNCVIRNNVSGLGRKVHGEFVMGSGEFSRQEFIEFKSDIFSHLVENSVDGAIHFQCMDWRNQIEMMTAGERHYSELKNLLVWVKTNAGMSAFYRSQHELIYVWKSGTAKHINNFGLGGNGRWRSNVLEYPGCNTFRKGRDQDLEAHSTVKPTALVADLIRDVSNMGDIVLDPTSGSGTTILAAERVHRRARCIELDPKYVDVTIRRVKDRLGIDAIHVETGLTLDELAELRGATATEEDGE